MKRFLSAILIMAIMLPVLVGLAPVKASAATVDRYTVLVLDISGPETFSSGGYTIYEAETAVEYVKRAAISFLKDMANADGNNYVALVVYAENASILSDFTDNMDSLSNRVNNIYESSDRDRSIADGLAAADGLIRDIVDPDAIKNVILFTTGMTDSGDYNYDGQYSDETIGSDWYHSGTGVNLYAYANVAYTTAQTLKEEATLYTLGLFQTMQQMPSEGLEVAEFFQLVTKELASADDCFYNVANPSELEFAFGEIAETITARPGLFCYAGSIDETKDNVAQYWYSDAYFFKRASLYNASLATMSLCLELSCWSSHDQKEWYDPDILPEDDAFFADKLVNAKTLLLGNPKAGEGFGGIGFTDFVANEYWEKDPERDSIGVCLARRQIKDRDDNKYTLVAVVIRGGGYGSEWASNFTVGEDGNHTGFENARNEVLRFLTEYLQELGANESKQIKLWIVGYSRAGATANMVAGHLCDNPAYLGYYVDQEDIFCYTFEAPQGVLSSNLYGNYENIHNVLNANDFVPHVAPSAWGFTRYNDVNSIYLPSRYTTNEKDFEAHLAAMLEQLDALGYSKEEMEAIDNKFVYNIQEYCDIPAVKVDMSKILPFGDPPIELVDSCIPSYTALVEGTNFLANQAIGSRYFYYDHMEDGVRDLLDILCHYDGKMAGLANYHMDLLTEIFTLENLWYMISPMLSLNPFKTLETRIAEVEARVAEKVAEIYGRELAEHAEALAALTAVITRVVVQVAVEVWNNDTDSLNTICRLVNALCDNVVQAHYPEVCLAWCRSQDPNYNTNVADLSNSTVSRVVRVNCPVDVYVYDEDGNLIASIVGDVPDPESQLICYVNDHGEKIIYIPADADYSIDMEATDTGTVCYSVGEYSFVYSDMTRMQNYYDIPVEEGDVLSAYLTAATDKSLEENSYEGTNAEYILYWNGYYVDYDEAFYGDDLTRLDHEITLVKEGNGGYVSGAGTYLQGSFASVEAYVMPNAQFLGWYDEDDNLLSEETMFRFAVRDSQTLTAKFTDVQINELKLEAGEGGKIKGTPDYYAQDMRIGLLAVPDEGYEFAGWEVTAGQLNSTSDLEVVFVMPGEGATVRAKFVQIGGPQTDYSQAYAIGFLIGGSMMLLGVMIITITGMVLGVQLKKKNR